MAYQRQDRKNHERRWEESVPSSKYPRRYPRGSYDHLSSAGGYQLHQPAHSDRGESHQPRQPGRDDRAQVDQSGGHFDQSRGHSDRRGSCPGRGRGRQRGTELEWKVASAVVGPLPRTFLISGQCGADHGPFRRLLKEELRPAFREVVFDGDEKDLPPGSVTTTSEQRGHVGFLLLEQSYHYNHRESIRYDPRVSQLTSCIKNQLPARDKQCLANKHALYRHLTRYAEQHPSERTFLQHRLPYTRAARDVHEVEEGQVLIVKPVSATAGCGVGIQIVVNSQQLADAKRQLLSQHPDAIVSNYVRRPLLFDNRKFHLRMYLLCRGPIACSCQRSRPPSSTGSASSASSAPTLTAPVCTVAHPTDPEGFDCEFWEEGKIFTARLPYRDADYQCREIHDTHGGSTERNYFFPEHMSLCSSLLGGEPINAPALCDDLLQQLRAFIPAIKQTLQENMRAWSYEDANFAYEVFGCDFLVQTTDEGDHQVVLLEINDKMGFKCSFGGNEPSGWPPAEGPLIYQWDLSRDFASLAPDAVANIMSYSSFSSRFLGWVWSKAIAPFYRFLDPAFDAVIHVEDQTNQQKT